MEPVLREPTTTGVGALRKFALTTSLVPSEVLVIRVASPVSAVTRTLIARPTRAAGTVNFSAVAPAIGTPSASHW